LTGFNGASDAGLHVGYGLLSAASPTLSSRRNIINTFFHRARDIVARFFSRGGSEKHGKNCTYSNPYGKCCVFVGPFIVAHRIRPLFQVFFNRRAFDKSLNAGSTGFTAIRQPLSGWVEKNLFAESFLRVADFILNLPGYLFGNTLAFQVGIVGHLARLFLDLALYFVNLPDDFILNAWLHLTPVLTFDLQLRARTAESSSFRGAPMSVGVRET
jgi:hypothetical protein